MAFKKTVQLHYENLSEGTKLRFIELEINQAINLLSTTLYAHNKYPKKEAMEQIALVLVPDNDRKLVREDLLNAFNHFRFRKPQKEEIIHYFRYKNIGNMKIAKYARTSPNRVHALKDSHPDFIPVFPSWMGFNGLIKNWEGFKHTLNLFNDELIQDKTNHVHEVFGDHQESSEEDTEQITLSVVPEEQCLEPVGVFEAQRLFPFDKSRAVDCMIQVYVAAYGHADMDEPYRSDIYNGKHNLIELGVIDYIQDPEDKKQLLKLYGGSN